jgi:signal transduction histidine kinase
MVPRGVFASLLLSLGALAAREEPLDCTVREAMEMSPDQVASQRPRRLSGLLTFHEPGHRMAFLQDATGAIYLQIKDAQPASAGDLVEVVGIVDPGIDGPNIRGMDEVSSPSIRKIGTAPWPAPAEETAARVASGISDASWTRIEGRIVDVEVVGDRVRLSLADAPELPVYLPGITRQAFAPGHLKGARVAISGVPAASPVSTQPPVMQRSLLVPSLEHVVMDPADRRSRFAAPEALLHDLRWIPEKEGAGRTTRVRGVVTWVQSGRGFFLQRGSSSAWIQCTESTSPQLDQAVECAGVPGSYHGGGVLHDSIWQPLREPFIAPITPLEAPGNDLLSDENHGRLVTIEGTVAESFQSPTEDMVILSHGSSNFSARLIQLTATPGLPTIERGSLVRVSGICLNRPSPGVDLVNGDGRFQIQLRNAGDMVTLASPPYWNATRLSRLIAGLLILSLLAAAWVIALKRRVHLQEIVIRDQVSRQAVHDERVRIAREWHDTFEQHFAGLTMQLDATATVLPPDTLPRQMLDRAAEMADHSRSEARQAIWDLRAPDPSEGSTFLHELELSLRGSWPEEGTPRLAIEGSGAATFPRRVTAHLLRIAHEAVANAHKHAAASHIVVRWTENPDDFQLTVSDDGQGIPPEEIGNATARGHFGLLGLRERAHKLKAVLRIESPAPDQTHGTLVSLTLPRSSIQNP